MITFQRFRNATFIADIATQRGEGNLGVEHKFVMADDAKQVKS
jgi:hypothetical protein